MNLQVHKKLGNTHLALMNFSWANDLDPKGANNQIKEAIDKPYHTDDDDLTAGELRHSVVHTSIRVVQSCNIDFGMYTRK